jgi:hypothetical protein
MPYMLEFVISFSKCKWLRRRPVSRQSAKRNVRLVAPKPGERGLVAPKPDKGGAIRCQPNEILPIPTRILTSVPVYRWHVLFLHILQADGLKW